MNELENISVYYLNKKKRAGVLSLKEELFFQELADLQIPTSFIVRAIDEAYYKYGSKLNIKKISRSLNNILSEMGYNTIAHQD